MGVFRAACRRDALRARANTLFVDYARRRHEALQFGYELDHLSSEPADRHARPVLIIAPPRAPALSRLFRRNEARENRLRRMSLDDPHAFGRTRSIHGVCQSVSTADTVHWGYFSKKLKPQVEIDSGDFITIEALTHHANDDAERMVKGDPGAESVFLWTKDKKGVNRRGAGPMDGSLFGRGAGEGQGVHICTGPVFVRGAEEGDVLEVRIIDVKPRPAPIRNMPGKAFGSNAAANGGAFTTRT
jgi:hypothetical protein